MGALEGWRVMEHFLGQVIQGLGLRPQCFSLYTAETPSSSSLPLGLPHQTAWLFILFHKETKFRLFLTVSKTFPSHPRPPLLTSPPGGPLAAGDGWAGGGDWLWGRWKLLSKGGNCSQRSPSGESEGGKVSPHIREGSIFLERHSPGQRAQAGS